MSAPLERAMAERSVDELRRICTRDAPDYTEEALAAARAELVLRGEDVSALVPRKGEPSGPPKESQEKLTRLLSLAGGGWLLFGALGLLVPPLRTLSTACFVAMVILGLWRISR